MSDPDRPPDSSDPAGPTGAGGPGGGPQGPGPANVQPTRPGPLVIAGAVAAVVGWAVRPVSFRLDVAEPLISLWNVLGVWVLALVTAALAASTWRTLQRPAARRPGVEPPRLEPHQAVNRLVLGKAAAFAGAIALGGYAGFAIAHLGIPATDLARQRLVRSSLCALGGLALLVAGLLLERACRVREDTG